MTILEWLITTMDVLKQAGVDSPRRDALVLLEDEIKKERSWVISRPEHELSISTVKNLNLKVSKRQKRRPLAYIRNKAWFYGRFFNVDDTVLIPRPESEDIIDILKNLKPKKIIDIGTGSGCLAVTAKLEIPTAEVFASDISDSALKVAQQNSLKHNASINFIQGSILQNLDSIIDKNTVIIANLPYVPKNLVTSPEIEFEPKLALFSGIDGLDHYRLLWQQINNLSIKPHHVITESLESQHKSIENLAKPNYKIEKTNLLIQVFRPA